MLETPQDIINVKKLSKFGASTSAPLETSPQFEELKSSTMNPDVESMFESQFNDPKEDILLADKIISDHLRFDKIKDAFRNKQAKDFRNFKIQTKNTFK